MTSISSTLDEYRITPGFHVDPGTTAHCNLESDIVPAPTQRADSIETQWKHESALAIGSFSTVRLEKNELTGELRAVKLISKEVLLECSINYEHELGVFVAVKDVGVTLLIAYIYRKLTAHLSVWNVCRSSGGLKIHTISTSQWSMSSMATLRCILRGTRRRRKPKSEKSQGRS